MGKKQGQSQDSSGKQTDVDNQPSGSAAPPPVYLSLEDLKKELELLHKPWMQEFAHKLDGAVKSTDYVDGQVSQVVARVEKVEKVVSEMQAQGPEAWLVIQGLPVPRGETPEMLLDKTISIMRVVGWKRLTSRKSFEWATP